MKKLAVILAMALLVFSSAYLWLQLRNERARSADLETRLNEIEVEHALRPPHQSQPQLAAINPAAQAGTGPDTPVASAAARRPDSAAIRVDNNVMQEMFSTPEGKASMLPTLRAVLGTQYPDLGKALNLTPQELDKLMDLLSRQRLDMAANSLGGTRDASAQERQRQAVEQQRTSETELQALLGGKYPQWQDYEQTLPARQQMGQLTTLLNSNGNPLGEAQSNRLLTALTAEQRRINQETPAMAAAPAGNPREMVQQQMQRTADNNRRLLEAATPILNSQQIDSYQRMLDQQQNLTRRILGSMD